jgi:hypothetical protein
MTGDDAVQSRIARAELANADVVCVALPTLCELAWVPSRGYKLPLPDIARVTGRPLDTARVAVNRPAAQARQVPSDFLG